MPSYAFLDCLEHYLLTGKFQVNTSKSWKKLVSKDSKKFTYKGTVDVTHKKKTVLNVWQHQTKCLYGVEETLIEV